MGPVQIEYKASEGDLEGAIQTASFDELILAIDADSALRLLSRQASWFEKRVLGSVKYLYDVTITHSDLDYMKKVGSYILMYHSKNDTVLTASLSRSITKLSITPRITHPSCKNGLNRSERRQKKPSPLRQSISVRYTTPSNIRKIRPRLK